MPAGAFRLAPVMGLTWILLAAFGVADECGLAQQARKVDQVGSSVERSTQELTGRVEALIRQLNADTQRKREEAQRALVELGPEILPLLPDPKAGGLSAEQRRRLQAIREKLQASQLQRLFAATCVTVQKGTYSVAELLEQIRLQTGNEVLDARGGQGEELLSQKVEVEWQQLPFWRALDELCAKAGLTVSSSSEPDGRLRLIEGRRKPLPTMDAGAVRVQAQELILRRLYGPSLARGQLVLTLTWEPRLTVARVRLDPKSVVILDDLNTPLSPFQLERSSGRRPVVMNSIEQSISLGDISCVLPLDLQPPRAGAKAIQTVQGTVELLALSTWETATFGPLRGGFQGEKSFSDGRVAVDDVAEQEEIWRIRLRIEYKPQESVVLTESYEDWFLNNRIQLVHRMTKQEFSCNGGYNVLSTGEASVLLEYLFLGLPGPISKYDLVVKFPSRPYWVPVHFSLSQLELPVQ
jgi:hypothetical protein